MTFKKLYIKEIKGSAREINPQSSYIISLKPTDGYDVYFTDDAGLELVNNGLLNKSLRLSELPAPLLKQIK